MTFEAAHRRRIEACDALVAEMLPSPEDELGQIRAEFRDAQLCRDRAAMERTDEEAARRMDLRSRLVTLWGLMCAAQDARDEALSKATAAEIRSTVQEEFYRRNPRPRVEPGKEAK